MDNLKGFLILCVVLGHLLEQQTGNLTNYLYLTIYSFHMPLFVWVCGYFAKNADQRCLRTLVLPYVVFQVIYELCALYLWEFEREFKLLEPYWLMWFILSLLLWRLLLPLVDVRDVKRQGLVLLVTAVLSLLSGMTEEIRHVLSFQRTVALFPMFLLGRYCRDWKPHISGWWRGQDPIDRGLYRMMLLAATGGGLALLYLFREQVNPYWMYWRYAYGEMGGSMTWRAMLLLAAVLFLGLALTMAPDKRLPLLTWLGQNTMPVYLLHGLVAKTLEWRHVYGLIPPWPLTLTVTALVVLAFSSAPVVRLFDWCFGSRKKQLKPAISE